MELAAEGLEMAHVFSRSRTDASVNLYRDEDGLRLVIWRSGFEPLVWRAPSIAAASEFAESYMDRKATVAACIRHAEEGERMRQVARAHFAEAQS